MNSFAGIPLETLLLQYVLEPAVRSLALGAGVWLLLTAFRVRDISFRLAAWTAVLYAALAMPFLGKVLPEIPVILPAVHTPTMAQAPSTTKEAVPVVSERFPAMSESEALSSIPAQEMVPVPETGSLDGANSSAPLGGSGAIRDLSEKVGTSGLFSAGSRDSEKTITNTNPVNLASYKSDQTTRRGIEIPWLLLAGLGYCAMAGILLARFALGLFLSGKLRREAVAIHDEELSALLAREMREAGVPQAPRLAESAALTVPATLGAIRPVILFPTGWREWNQTQMSAVLAHELSHIARHDPRTQLLAALHHSFFWFSPLSWWLNRSLEEMAEQVSDDDALRAGVDRTRYAEVLLNFLATLKAGRGRVRWQAVSMAQGARSRRRLERILAGGRLSRRLGQGAIVGIVLGALPLVCLAAALEPTFGADLQMPAAQPLPPPPAPPANLIEPGGPQVPAALAIPGPKAAKAPAAPGPATAPSPAPPALQAVPLLAGPAWAPVAPQIAGIIGGRIIVMAPETLLVPLPNAQARPQSPTPPAVPEAAPNPPPPPAEGVHMSEFWNYNGDHCGENQAFVIVSGDRTISECGSMDEVEHVQELRHKIHGPFIWFRRDGRSYVIQDPETVKAAIAAFGPQRDLGRQQGLLGRQQAELGRQQAELGFRQREVRVGIPDLSEQMAQLDARMRSFDFSSAESALRRAQAQLAAAQEELQKNNEQDFEAEMRKFREAVRELDSSTTQQMIAQAQAQAALIQSKLGSLQALAGEKQSELGRQQAELGRRQAALGKQQAALGRQQAEAARKAAAQIQKLIDHALAKGLAKPE